MKITILNLKKINQKNFIIKIKKKKKLNLKKKKKKKNDIPQAFINLLKSNDPYPSSITT